MNDINQNNDPTTIKINSENPTSSGVPVIDNNRKGSLKAQQRQADQINRAINPYANDNSEKVQRESGLLRSAAQTYTSNPYGKDYFQSKFWGIDTGQVSSTGGDYMGGANPFNENYDFEHDRRAGQSNIGAGVNIVNQFVGKTAVNTAGSILAGFYGLGSAAVNGDTSKLWDNSVARGFDKASEWVDENNSVFTSEHARSQQGALDIFNVEGMKNLGDGMSFVAGAVLSELAMGALTGGVGNAIKGTAWGVKAANTMGKAGKLTTAQLGNAMSAISMGNKSLKGTGEAIKRASTYIDDLAKSGVNGIDDLEDLSRTLGISAAEDMVTFQKFNNFITGLPKAGRSIVTGTFWESGLEARQGKDEFYTNQMEKVDNDLMLRTDLSTEEKATERARQEKVIREMSNDVGSGIFALNTMVLQASNMVQFPSLFGRPKILNSISNATKVNPYNKVGSSLTEEAYNLKKFAKAGIIAKNTGRILKKPITEGLEEMSQSAISGLITSYYEDQLSTEYQQDLLNGEYAGIIGGLRDSMAGRAITQLADTFTDEEAYKEGVIGAVMGLIGAPSFRRNSKGKLRPTVAGGIWEDVNTARQDIKSLSSNLAVLNSQKSDLTSILGMNDHQAIINKKMAAKDDLAQLNSDEIQLHENQEINISNYVTRMKKLGMGDQIDNSIKDVESLSLEEYRKSFNKSDDFTEENKSDEIRNFKDTTRRYSEAFDLVENALNKETMKSNSELEKMVNVLVHGVGFEKYINQQREAIVNDSRFIDALSNNDLSQDDIDDMIKNSYEFKAVAETYQNVVDNLSADKQRVHKEKMDSLNLELENLLESLPADVRSATRSFIQAKNSNDASKIDEAESQFNSTLEGQNSDSKGVIIDTLGRYADTQNELNEGIKNLNVKTVEEWALSNDPEKVKAAKKEIEVITEKLNERILKQHNKDTKGFIATKESKEPKKFKYEDVLSYMKANKQLDSLDSFLEKSEENLPISEVLKGDYKTIKDTKDKLYLLENKRLSTVQLARDLIKMGGSRAYHKINIDSFNFGMKELNFTIAELEFATLENDENEIVVSTSKLKSLVDTLRAKADKLLEEKAVTKKELNDASDVLKRAEKLLETSSSMLEKKDIQDDIAKKTDDKAAQKNIDDQLSSKAEDTSSGDDGELKISINDGSLTAIKTDTDIKDQIKKEGEVSTDEKESLSKIAKRDLNDIVAEVNETSISALNPKLLFTLNPKDIPTSGIIPDSDIRTPNNTDPENSFRYKIDTGQIKYNSGGELIIPETDPLHSQDAKAYGDYLFGTPSNNKSQEKIDAEKALYIEGLEKVRGEGGIDLLDVPFENMDPAVKFYISKTRVIQNFYDKQVGIKESDDSQSLNISEDDTLIHSSYLYGASITHDIKDINKEKSEFESRIAELKENLLSGLELIKERLDEGTMSPSEYQRSHKLLNDNYENGIEKAKKGFDSLINGHNDFANFSLRLNAVKAALLGDTLKFRVGNFLYGEMDKSESTGRDSNGMLVETYPITNTDPDSNPLFHEGDPFSIDKLAYVNKDGDLVSYGTGEIIKTNTGSVLNKLYLSTGKNYAIVTLSNGHKIPVSINTETMGRDSMEPIVDELIEIIKDYTNNHVDLESINDNVRLKDDTLFTYAKNMNYKEFFQSLSNSWKSSTRSLSGDLGGFINIEGKTGKIHIGESLLLDRDTVVDDGATDVYDQVKTILVNNRFYVRRSAMFNKDDRGNVDYSSVNQAYLDFLINNNILTHTIKTSDENKVERLFTPVKDKHGNNYPVRPQIHMLNSESRPKTTLKKGYFENKKAFVYALLFGKGKIDNAKLKDEYTSIDIIKGLYTTVGSKLIREIMVSSALSDADKKDKLNQIIRDLAVEKINFAYEVFKTSPNLFTDFGKKIIETRGDLTDIAKLKLPKEHKGDLMDLYLFNVLKELNKMITNPKIMESVINYSSNINLAREYRELLLSGSNTVLDDFDAEEAVSDKTGNKYTVYKKSNKSLGSTDSSSYRFQISVINSKIGKLQERINNTKDTIDKENLQNEIETLKVSKQSLVDQRIKENKDVIKHILIVGNTMEAVYNIEKLFGGKKYIPNFQYNHSIKGYGGKTSNYRYNIDEKGNPIPLKGSVQTLENGSLITNKNKGPFTIEFKTNDNTKLISSDINDVDKITFDENGEVANANIMVTTVTMKSKEAIEKQNEENKTKDKSNRTYFNYNLGNAAIIQGTEMNSKHINVIQEIALPGLNADRTIDPIIQQQLINIGNQYGANTLEYRDNIESLTEYFKFRPDKDFGSLGEVGTSAKAKDVANDNKRAKISSDEIQLSTISVNTFATEKIVELEKPKEIPIAESTFGSFDENGNIVMGTTTANQLEYKYANLFSDQELSEEEKSKILNEGLPKINDDVIDNEISASSTLDNLKDDLPSEEDTSDDNQELSINSSQNLKVLNEFKNQLDIISGVYEDIAYEIGELFAGINYDNIHLNDTEANKFLLTVKGHVNSDEYQELRTKFINLAKEKGFDLNEENIC